MDKGQSFLVLLLNFLVVITLLPLGIDVFGNTGAMLVGEDVLYKHGWLATFFAYGPVLLLILIYLKASFEPFERFGLRWSRKWLAASVAIGALSALAIYGVDIATGTLSSFDVPLAPTLAVTLGYLLAWGVLAPFTEELLFRGVIQSVLSWRIASDWPVHPAVLLASGFEVLMHLSVPIYFSGDALGAAGATVPQLLYVAVFGLIGGYVYQRTQSLVGPVLIHGLGNMGELALFWLLS